MCKTKAASLSCIFMCRLQISLVLIVQHTQTHTHSFTLLFLLIHLSIPELPLISLLYTSV